jgi:hypothetical protein
LQVLQPSQASAVHSSAPARAAAASAPWWVWFVGGAVAVGIGIGAAIWYAERDAPGLAARSAPPALAAPPAPGAPPALGAPPAPPAPGAPLAPGAQPPASALPAQPAGQPTAQPIEPAVARAALVEVRFDSVPSGGVFAEGRAAELCRTPCTFDIDPADGGPTDRRRFIVKRDGYADGSLTVDLTGKERELHVVLQPSAPPTARGDARPDKRAIKHPVKTSRPGAPGPGKDPARDASAKASRDPSREDRSAGSPDRDRLLDPADGKPAASKPPGMPAIDPADTMDPFHKK